MENTRVSICTTVLNQSGWLKEMIQSVVDQTFKGWELLIADDGSTEDIKSVIESFNDKRIQYFRFDENKGGAERLNFLLGKAVGEFYSFLAADEVIYPLKLEQQLAYLDEHKGVDAVWGLPQTGPLGQRPDWEQSWLGAANRSRESWLRTLLNLENVPLGSCSMLMKTSVVRELGLLDLNLTMFNDHELYCRFFSADKVGVVLPYRWAADKPQGPDSVRTKNQHKAGDEWAYVRAKHKIIFPKAEGKVTVGIPCYNHAKYLPDAVNSVLAQTHPVDEILILDDGSTDDFKTVVAGLVAQDSRIKVMAFPENMGMQEAHNQMAFRAEGEFFTPLSADDMLEPTFVERCLNEFKSYPWSELVASHTDFYKEDMKEKADPAHPFFSIPKVANHETRYEFLEALRPGNQYFGCGMYRTKALSEIGGWEKQYKVISDYQVYIKLLQRENIRIIEEPLTRTRVHGENDSLLNEERAKELPWLYHAARKPYFRKHMRVFIATPFYELKGFSPYIVSLVHTLRLLQAVGIDYYFLELSGDSYVHRARNTMCEHFLADPEATDLFFIDSDMSWNPEAFVKMCMLPDDVVGGTYPVKNNWEAWTSIPQIYTEDQGSQLRGRDLGDGTALLEASVLAGGFLRIKRHVLEKFREHYPDLWYQEPSLDPKNPNKRFTQFFGAESMDHKFYGEDHCFSRRLREMGCKMFIYPNIDIVHWGYKPFEGNYDKWLKKAAKDRGVQEMIADKKAKGEIPRKL